MLLAELFQCDDQKSLVEFYVQLAFKEHFIQDAQTRQRNDFEQLTLSFALIVKEMK